MDEIGPDGLGAEILEVQRIGSGEKQSCSQAFLALTSGCALHTQGDSCLTLSLLCCLIGPRCWWWEWYLLLVARELPDLICLPLLHPASSTPLILFARYDRHILGGIVSLSLLVKMGTTDVSLYTPGKGNLAVFALGGELSYS